jgi:hypothetical protein
VVGRWRWLELRWWRKDALVVDLPVRLDARLMWSLWADRATECEMGQMCH